MTKIYSASPQTKAIYDKIMNKIQGKATLAENEYVIRKWYSKNGVPHSGQIFATKILPNGNIQSRITTVIGDVATVINDINIKSSMGEILNKFFSIIWKFGEHKSDIGQIFFKKVLPNGDIQTRLTTSAKNDATIMTDTRVITAKGKLKKLCFGIRGPQCTVADSNGEVIAELLPTKFYVNNPEDVRKARVNEKAVNPDMKFLV